MKCPKCKIENLEEANRCDCGYNFETGQLKESYLKGVSKNSKSIYVGFWKRSVATIIDCLIVSPLYIFYFRFYKDSLENKNILPIILFFIVIYGVNIYLNSKYGGTPGKLIMKIRIINRSGRYITIKQSFIRSLPAIINGVISLAVIYNRVGNDGSAENIVDNIFAFYGIADILVIFVNKEKRTIHDYLAGSFVVNKEDIMLENI
jgi:uncharacterized RDD family membrane protein YckC